MSCGIKSNALFPARFPRYSPLANSEFLLQRNTTVPSLPLRLSSLSRSLPIAPNHHHAQEASHHSATEQQENDRDANSPDAGREEGLDEVRIVDEGLCLR